MHTIQQHDLQVMKTLLRLTDNDLELPPAVEEAYWAFKRVRDFCMGTAPIHPDVLCWIVYDVQRRAGALEPPPAEAFDFAEALKTIATGDTLAVRWRNKDCEAVVTEITARQTVLAVLDGEAESREFGADRVLGILAKVEG